MHVRLLPMLILALATPAFAEPIQLSVDARDVTRNIIHVHEVVPATAGPLTLALPRWLPGYHGPEGKVVNLVDLHFAAGSKALEWQRDEVERDQFHLSVPEDAKNVTVDFDFLLKSDDVSRNVAVIEWNNVVLYPIPSKMTELDILPSITLPKKWEYATALHASESLKQKDGARSFEPVSLMTLIDSPLFAGRYHKSYDVGTVNGTPHHVEIFADTAAATEMEDETLAAQKRLPLEAFALFGSQHYARYQWLVALAGDLDDGIEHHESSDNRMSEDALSDESMKPAFSYLLSHEYVHSWNGKHRRPAAMVNDDFQQPQKTDLLWVYEGLTQYWGLVLVTRSGAWSPADFRDEIAGYYDAMSHRTGRDWRSLHDVAVDASDIYGTPPANAARRRSAGDFYSEGALIWLEADVKIRNLTDGKRSLDDFAKRFHGGAGGKPSVETYTFDDVVKTLNDVAPFDWATFLHDRVDKITAAPPVGGITEGGYHFDYAEEPSDFQEQRTDAADRLNFLASIGMNVDPSEGHINDVIPGSPADKAGVPVGGTIVAVNGMKFAADRLKNSVAATRETPLELIVEQRETLRTFKLEYGGGAKFPTLTRDESKPDRLVEIVKPLVEAKE